MVRDLPCAANDVETVDPLNPYDILREPIPLQDRNPFLTSIAYCIAVILVVSAIGYGLVKLGDLLSRLA